MALSYDPQQKRTPDRLRSPLRSFTDSAYLSAGGPGPLLFVGCRGPTLPWLDGGCGAVARARACSIFVFAPVVVDDIEDCLCCFCDLASAVNVEPTSPATAQRAPDRQCSFSA